MTLKRQPLALMVTVVLAASGQAHAQNQSDASPQQGATTRSLDKVTVTGSRVRGRTVENTAAPVDVVTSEELQATGATEVGQILQTVAPSFNFSRTFVSDGTDIIRPATLRSLGPDQVLVLVNGKRRHQQALVNVQQTVARGSAGTDINAIPISAIDRIEVLRDGAAAQYGSDAISGVINIILKKQTEHTDVSLQGGQTYKGDGRMASLGANTGFALGANGFLNITAEYRDRASTNRAGPDLLRVNPPRVTQQLGDADAKDRYLWLNGGLGLGTGELYWFGGLSKREGSSYGFYRSKGDNRTVPAVYPEGFLPNIVTTVRDNAMAVGYRAPINDTWDWDLSLNYGRSHFGFAEHNTINVSWWYEPKPGGGIYAQSPLEAKTGALIFRQLTANLDVHGEVAGFGKHPISVGTGLEWRRDGYQMKAGDPVSYTYGRSNNPAIVINGQAGGTAAPGTQGFPGFTPATEVNASRKSWAAYVDAETNLSDSFLLGAALRYENYSDFGNTAIGKLSMRYEASPALALRATVSNGFRAPGVQQQYYSQVSTNLKNGQLIDVMTARQGSAVTRGLGIPDLKQETSRNGSVGLVWKPNKSFSASVDLFRIDIKDRIVFSGEISPESVGNDGQPCNTALSNCPLAKILNPLRVGAAQFFTNAIDTRTTGLDVTLNQNFTFSGGSKLNLTGLMHFNRTKVTQIRSPSKLLTQGQLFDETQTLLIERGQPRSHHMLQGIWEAGAWEVMLRGNYYGAVQGMGFTGIKQTWGGKTLVDTSVRWKFAQNTSVAAGINNVFNVYPDKWTVGVTDPNNPAFNNPFPALGFTYGWETMPFGMNGGSWFLKLDHRF